MKQGKVKDYEVKEYKAFLQKKKPKTVLYIYMVFLEKNLESQISPKITGMTVLL